MSISSTLVDRAQIEFREAAEALRPFVGCFWVITAERGATIRVVPDGSTAISVQLQEGLASEWMLRARTPKERSLGRRIPPASVTADRTTELTSGLPG